MAEALRMSRAARFAPLALLLLVVAALVWRLATPSDTNVRSKMIGKNLADVRVPPALPGRAGVWVGDSYANPRVINFFGSWCVPCIAEAPVLAELKRQGIPIDGIAVRDRPRDIAEFLEANGDPYNGIGADPESKVQIQFGAAGVPETFIVDPYGTVRYQHIGPIQPKDVATIRKKWEALRK
jgi:cytochrome c biogenesis protein CcmG, thiol:disulfide interchange protein DsbE